jgi:hypothetical protein
LADDFDGIVGDGICGSNGPLPRCTLHAAIQEAIAHEPALAVRFNVTGVIQLASPLPILGKSIVIEGPGAGRLTILASPGAPVFEVAGQAAISGFILSGGSQAGIRVIDDGKLTATRITVSQNTAGGVQPGGAVGGFKDGGGIYNRGIVTLADSLVTQNTAQIGAGILNSGVLHLVNSIVSENVAADDPRGSASGGGIATSGTATITNSRIIGNRAGNGGGLSSSGNLIIENSEISDNLVPAVQGQINHGGGMYISGKARIIGSLITRNAASYGGGIFKNPDASLEIIRSSISSNSATTSGGGIINNRGPLSLEASTIANNQGSGLINNRGTATLTNVTVSGHGARGIEGIRNSGVTGDFAALRMVHSTIVGNWIGIATDGVSQATLRATILAGNGTNCSGFISGPGQAPGVVMSDGANFSSDSSCSFAAVGDRNRTDPLLEPLANNGGATWTHALRPESPAVDAAGSCDLVSDQRGVARPQAGTPEMPPACDSGSYEFQFTAP